MLNTLYRPLQYLGAKTRSLDVITSECKKLYTRNSYVVDLFSGSSIVSQSFYNEGMQVIANDVMHFCSDISHCMLNISKTNQSKKWALEGLNSFKDFHLAPKFLDPFSGYIERENSLLQSEDLNGLKDLYSQLPQVGKISSSTDQIDYIRTHYNNNATNDVPLIANYYAGTYFGIKQAIRLDCLRTFIENFFNVHNNVWAYTAMLTSLYNTLSMIVHSAGKHFSQPIAIKNTNKNKITNKRLFENRNYDIDKLFTYFLTLIITHTENGSIQSRCLSTCDNIQTKSFQQLLESKKISVIYADPPYTAQQYSRFYHIPEVIRTYRYPILQEYRGHITQGLYPINKFKSDFCSKRKAVGAFETIFKIANNAKANLLISYSESQNKETGNERMISKSDIIRLADLFLPNYKVNIKEFLFDYRQLNSSDKIVTNKDDKEYLLIFKRR